MTGAGAAAVAETPVGIFLGGVLRGGLTVPFDRLGAAAAADDDAEDDAEAADGGSDAASVVFLGFFLAGPTAATLAVWAAEARPSGALGVARLTPTAAGAARCFVRGMVGGRTSIESLSLSLLTTFGSLAVRPAKAPNQEDVVTARRYGACSSVEVGGAVSASGE